MVAAGVPGPGSKKSFAAFVATSADGLRREVRADARRRGLPADVDVDDVVQTAFVRLLPVYERLDTEYAAFNYAHKTALRALDDLRKRDRVRHDGWLESVYRRHHSAPADPEEEALRGLRAADVRRAFGRLPLSQRQALALVDMEELRQAEAAHVMGVSPTVLKGLVQRGRERLRRDLVHAPMLTALLGIRRRTLLAPAAAAPALTVMAALLLAVTHLPGAPAGRPYVSDAATRPAPVVRMAGPAAPAVAPRPAPRTRKTAPVAVAPRRAPKAQPPPAAQKKLPDAGACVGPFCVGDPVGDSVCLRAEPRGLDVCVTQDIVDLCPLPTAAETVVRCRRDGNSVVTPPPTPAEEL